MDRRPEYSSSSVAYRSEGENDRDLQLDLNAHPPPYLFQTLFSKRTHTFSPRYSLFLPEPPPTAQGSSSFLSLLLRPPGTPPSPRATMASAADPISIDDEDMDPSGENQVINEVRSKRATTALGFGGDGAKRVGWLYRLDARGRDGQEGRSEGENDNTLTTSSPRSCVLLMFLRSTRSGRRTRRSCTTRSSRTRSPGRP